MACTVVATAGSATANSYATIAEGTAYHDTHITSEVWDDADDDERCRALQTATRNLDLWMDWEGVPATQDQALRWPRAGVEDADGNLVDSTTIPTDIKNGTAEYARHLLSADSTAESDVVTQGITRVQAGSVEVEFSGSATAKPIPDSVLAFVSIYGTKKGAGGSGGTVTLRRA